MKTMALIGLILLATVSTGIAADTLMTIQTNTTVKIDPITGQVKGDAQTEVRGIRKSQDLPEAVKTSAPGTAVAATSDATTPVTGTPATDPSTAAAPVSVTAPDRPEDCYCTSWSSFSKRSLSGLPVSASGGRASRIEPC